jgi:Lipocalin-like domain
MTRLFLGVALTFALSLAAMADDNSIVGTWRIQSLVREVIATGERQNEFGEKPGGYISYQPDGRMFVMFVADNRIKPSSASPTDEEKVKLFGTLIAYSGTYVLDRDKVTHKIDVSWNQSWTDDEQVRFYKLEGKMLTITSAINKSPRDGREGRVIVMLRKVQ